MRLLKQSDKYRIFSDGDTIIKIGPRDSIVWEHDILKELDGIAGVPQVRGLTPPMGGFSGDMTLIMDRMNGVSLDDLTDLRQLPSVIPSLYSILLSIYSRNICHLRVTPDHIIVDPMGVVSLVGFSKAARVESVSQSSMGSSPDIIGVINHDIVNLKSRHIPKVEGGYPTIADYITKMGGQLATNNR